MKYTKSIKYTKLHWKFPEHFLRLRITQKVLPFFFYFCFSFCVFGRTAKSQKLFSGRSKISYQRGEWPRSDSFPGHTKNYIRKNCFSSCTWHVLFTVTSIRSIPKSTRNYQKIGNKLASWYVIARWQKIQGSSGHVNANFRI